MYFHGWGGHFDETKNKILSKFGDEVYFPDIDYQNMRNLIGCYTNEAYGSKTPTLIIGNSLGGYLAYHISNICKFPALLFNPAFFFKNGGELRPNSNSESDGCLDKNIIISLKDEELDVKRTLKFLKENGFDSQIKMYNNLTHQIPIDVFENEFTSFREMYKDFKMVDQKKPSRYSIGSKISKTTYQPDDNDERWWEQDPDPRPVVVPMGEPVRDVPMGEPVFVQPQVRDR